MKYFLSICFLGAAVLGGVSGDKKPIACFLEKQLARLGPLAVGGQVKLDECKFVPSYLEGSRDDAKECSTKKIKVDDAITFMKDVCTAGSVLNTEFQSHAACMSDDAKMKPCMPELKPIDPTSKDLDDALMKLASDLCGKLKGLYKCYNEKVGEACGVKNLTEKYVDAVDSYLSGVCAEVNGATNVVLQWSVLLGFVLLLITWNKY